MNLGKLVRLNRIFSHPSGRLCSVAVDHFFGYGISLPQNLRQIKVTLQSLVAGRPDAITLQKGIAASAWTPYAGLVPLIVQGTAMHPKNQERALMATPEDAVRLGADAFAMAAFLDGTGDAATLREIADCVRDASRFDIPVICNIYPRNLVTGKILLDAENIAWVVHCAAEIGVDVVKTPYCGEVKAFSQIVAECPVPVVAAGAPKCDSLRNALELMSQVVQSGARGATIGRNIWGSKHIAAVMTAFKAILHDCQTAEEALKVAGLPLEEEAA